MIKRTPTGRPVPKLREWREWAVLTQIELAKKAGISSKTVIDIEQGKATRYKTIGKLAQALDITRQELIYSAPVLNQAGA